MKHEHQHQHPHLEQDEIRCSCDHDHDHSKEQHAHPEEPCSCGHDHREHQHHSHQEASCSCGHDHDKHKDHGKDKAQHPNPGHEDISITHHENAVIVSAEREISGDYILIKETLELGLKALADWVESQDGLIGHIKAHLTEKGKNAMFSTTGDVVHIKETHHPSVTLNLAVIVFVNDEAALADQVSAMIKNLPQ